MSETKGWALGCRGTQVKSTSKQLWMGHALAVKA